jgi:bacterioferritin-associated ferredoxin
MIVCSCNVLSDDDVRKAATTCGGSSLRNAKQVYDYLGCNAECGRCAGTIKEILQKAVN